MLEYRKEITELDYPNKDGSLISETWQLFYNNERIRYVLIDYDRNEILSYFKESSEKLIELLPNEFPKDCKIALHHLENFDCVEVAVEINTFVVSDFEENVNCSIIPNLSRWNNFYTFEEYKEIFSGLAKKSNLEIAFTKRLAKESLDLIVSHNFTNNSIKDNLNFYIENLKGVHFEAIKSLETKKYRDKINVTFNFPEELKVPCEQYLLHFAQFLRDLGINATSNLKEEAGKVLFSFTPTDDIEALEKIREALAIYLSFASNPIPHSTGDRTVDMVLSGARANAKHLESQLELAIAKLQFKEATLELKDATIEQHQLALRQKDETIKGLQEMVARGNIFEESLERIEVNGEEVDVASLYRFSRGDDDVIEVEAIPVLEETNEETKVGIVKFHEVTKLKDYGVSFDLPKAIRGLIDFFKRNKDK